MFKLPTGGSTTTNPFMSGKSLFNTSVVGQAQSWVAQPKKQEEAKEAERDEDDDKVSEVGSDGAEDEPLPPEDKVEVKP